jgi:iron-sulfur cluster repair protein YtfE (RIC family)
MARAEDQPGLRLRLTHEARRIATQHAYLDALAATTRRAVERGDEGEAREALRGFRGALESHFALEEQLHFPALHGLHPALGDELAALVREHGEFRAALERLEQEPVGASGIPGLEALFASLRRHEDREERLLGTAEAKP